VVLCVDLRLGVGGRLGHFPVASVDSVMMPIVEYLGVVEEFVGWFDQDLSLHELKRFKEYLTGVITNGKPIISRIVSRLVDRVDQSSL
jgi:hypothetical protein